jgi:hypothetical protein
MPVISAASLRYCVSGLRETGTVERSGNRIGDDGGGGARTVSATARRIAAIAAGALQRPGGPVGYAGRPRPAMRARTRQRLRLE